jgi:hypothetical protein
MRTLLLSLVLGGAAGALWPAEPLPAPAPVNRSLCGDEPEQVGGPIQRSSAVQVIPRRPPPSPLVPTADVRIVDDSFSLPITVKRGTTVCWTNSGRHAHTVTSSRGLWDSGPIKPGAEFCVRFDQPGMYPYVCKFHSREMRGMVEVL